LKNFFDRPTKAELIDVLHYFIFEEIDFKKPEELDIFKVRIALNVLKILKRQVSNENKISEKLNALSQNLLGEEISSKQNLIKKIKKEDFNKDSIEEFLFELAREKLSIDNPSYIKD
tara:strand:- start:49 stop:399 length:351 start_codon:yes stop_codon:yes gene_type:complete